VRRVHSVHVTTKKKWQTVIAANGDDHVPGVRRLAVPGGWIYQIERYSEVDDLDAISRIEWSLPVFVPFHGDGE
jgi:hypothetical protein